MDRALALAFIVPFLLSRPAITLAQGRVLANDRDLSPRASQVGHMEVPLEIPADAVRTITDSGALNVRIIRLDHGVETTITALPEAKIRACTRTRSRARVEIPLEGKWFTVGNGSQSYSVVADVPCAGTHELLFRQDTNGGQALGIWQIAERAHLKIEKELGMGFWKTPIEFAWPADGDYYSWGTVHLTRGDAWDVVGHEMGHAIYDQGGIGTFAGGDHKIDACYSEELAFSEGWASFFSAWVSVGLSDPDAKFEYMVPRRAPIRFETIPSDVCRGESNEWRVTGFFWDLIDLHDDGEKAQNTFARVWNALFQAHVSSASEARTRLEAAGLNREELATVWKLNFQTQP